MTVTGARLVSATEPTGTPFMQFGIQPFQPLLHPVSVAGHGADTYIADLGARAVYRFDSTLNVLALLPGVAAAGGIQLHVGPDLSLYVLDQPARRVLHFTRAGQLLVTFRDDVNLGRPVDVAVDETRGRMLVADGMFNHLVAFHPLGRAAYVIPLRSAELDRVLSIAGLAVAGETIYLSDPARRCIVRVNLDGVVLSTFGRNDLQQPGPIAVDRHQRLFVVDTFEGSLKIFLADKLVESIQPGELGLQRINDVWIGNNDLLLSDGAGARVAIMHIVAPAR